jgi:hypothetical protein
MRAKQNRSYTQARCALTARLRRRAQAAEARAARAEALQREAEDRAGRFYRQRNADRDALLDFLESPEWERDLLIILRARLRQELSTLSNTRRSCASCGSFGRGFYDHVLDDAIDALTRRHGLPSVSPLPPMDWPVAMGRVTKDGRGLNAAWLAPALS